MVAGPGRLKDRVFRLDPIPHSWYLICRELMLVSEASLSLPPGFSGALCLRKGSESAAKLLGALRFLRVVQKRS